MESNWQHKILRALAYETKHFDLISPRRREDCVRLLLVNTDSEWALFGSHPVAGRVYDTTFSLSRRSSYNIRLQTIVRGEFIEELRQTRLACWSGPRLGLHTVPIVATMLAGTAFAFGLRCRY